MVGLHSVLRLHFLLVGLYSKLQQRKGVVLQCLAQDSILLIEGRLFIDPQPGTSPTSLEYGKGHVDPGEKENKDVYVKRRGVIHILRDKDGGGSH